LKSLSLGEKEKLARGVMERDKEWAVIDAYDKGNDETWGSGKKKRDWAEGNPEEDFWELNKLPEILERIDRDKREERERAEERRREENRKKWLQRVGELEENARTEQERADTTDRQNEKEKEKEKEKDTETSVERKFRLKSERSLGHQQWRDQINRLMTRRPEPRVRYDGTDSPLSFIMEEGELDFLTQPSEETEEWKMIIITIIIRLY
jgi:hypothetical protein